MIKNIIYQRSDCLIITENSLHLAQLTLTLGDNIRISIISHNIVLGIYQTKRSFIQFQLNNAALIINRTSSAILDCLRHIINVNVITKDLAGATILH